MSGNSKALGDSGIFQRPMKDECTVHTYLLYLSTLASQHVLVLLMVRFIQLIP